MLVILERGQGLEQIVPEAAKKLGEDFMFRIVGDGGAKQDLVKKVQDLGLKNVVFQNPVNRAELVDIYQASDFLFLHLNNYKAFELVLPSKVFEYGASGESQFWPV